VAPIWRDNVYRRPEFHRRHAAISSLNQHCAESVLCEVPTPMKLIFKWNKYRTSQGWKVRLYRHEYPISKPTHKFEALAFIFGCRIFWIFEKTALENWPSTNG
jgi:hypothetical protein